jgi:hypothetical protein
MTELYWARYILAALLAGVAGGLAYTGVLKRPARWR